MGIKLAPPGAGLPAAELAFSKVFLAAVRWLKSRHWADAHFEREAGVMLRLTRNLSPEGTTRRVLIPRVLGIEDSSRHWSVLMTLEHIAIVDSAVIDIIEHLASERMYIRPVSIAAVKPSAEQTSETIQQFLRATQDYMRRVARVSKLNTATRHPHPWFGPLDALGWHLLAALHHTIHRRQIERIIAHAKPPLDKA